MASDAHGRDGYRLAGRWVDWVLSVLLVGHRMTFEHGEWQCRCETIASCADCKKICDKPDGGQDGK